MIIVDFSSRPGAIDGLAIVTMKQVTDERGTVRELFRRSTFADAGTPFGQIEQINVTATHRGGVRGMHAEQMTKLVAVAHGHARGVYVDVRPGSPTFGLVDEVDLELGVQVLVPSGVANGFQALAPDTQYAYCFDHEWAPGMPGSAFTPLDALVVDRWPLPIDPDDPAQISAKDRQALTFDQLTQELSQGMQS
jgi:dTDP-4-dehydrorhamnose 3,5-epimerase